MKLRIGIGYDIHRLAARRKLYLGGMRIPYNKGLLGHSDADVLLHAITDALLGALSLGDIGDLFPDTDLRYKDIAGSVLLKKAYALVRKRKYTLHNLDTVIIAQEPKLLSYKNKIRQNIAGILSVDKEKVSIKAKTNEGLGDIGKKKAISAYAVVLLKARV